MPRRSRCVLPGVACHITQGGVDRRETFSDDGDRRAYARLLQQNLRETQTRLLGWCLMTNHVHLIAVPEREDSLSILLRRVHGRYAQYYNVRAGRTGHLWQNRFFACVLEASHLWTALVYVERNPVRAGIVSVAEDYPWSSATPHLAGEDPSGLLDMDGGAPKRQQNGVESFIASNLSRTPTSRCALAPMLVARLAAKTFSVRCPPSSAASGVARTKPSRSLTTLRQKTNYHCFRKVATQIRLSPHFQGVAEGPLKIKRQLQDDTSLRRHQSPRHRSPTPVSRFVTEKQPSETVFISRPLLGNEKKRSFLPFSRLKAAPMVSHGRDPRYGLPNPATTALSRD